MITQRKRFAGVLGALAVVGAVAGIGLTYGTSTGPMRAAQASPAVALACL